MVLSGCSICAGGLYDLVRAYCRNFRIPSEVLCVKGQKMSDSSAPHRGDKACIVRRFAADIISNDEAMPFVINSRLVVEEGKSPLGFYMHNKMPKW